LTGCGDFFVIPRVTTFDRYILGRFFHSYVILFVSLFGLFVVFDGFTNVDNFQQEGLGAGAVLAKMATYYLYQSSLIFDLVGSILSAISVLIVFSLLQRNSELHPVLAAGIPMFRLFVPVILGTVVISAALAANQELIIPRISHMLQASRSGLEKGTDQVEPVYDNASLILIDGERLSLGKRKILDAKFVLPVLEIAQDLTRVEATEATYRGAKATSRGINR